MKSVKNLNNVKSQLAVCNSKAIVGGDGLTLVVTYDAATRINSGVRVNRASDDV